MQKSLPHAQRAAGLRLGFARAALPVARIESRMPVVKANTLKRPAAAAVEPQAKEPKVVADVTVLSEETQKAAKAAAKRAAKQLVEDLKKKAVADKEAKEKQQKLNAEALEKSASAAALTAVAVVTGGQDELNTEEKKKQKNNVCKEEPGKEEEEKKPVQDDSPLDAAALKRMMGCITGQINRTASKAEDAQKLQDMWTSKLDKDEKRALLAKFQELENQGVKPADRLKPLVEFRETITKGKKEEISQDENFFTRLALGATYVRARHECTRDIDMSMVSTSTMVNSMTKTLIVAPTC